MIVYDSDEKLRHLRLGITDDERMVIGLIPVVHASRIGQLRDYIATLRRKPWIV